MFRTGMPVYGDDFIDRIEQQKKFKTYIREKQHILIKAPRRFGKTSLVKHLFETNEFKTIYIDIRRTRNLTSLSEQIINQAYQFIGVQNIIEKIKNSALSIFKLFKGEIKIDIGIAELTIEKIEAHSRDELEEIDYFMYALDLVEQIGNAKNINIKFALDEFQDILQLTHANITETMRAHIQHHRFVTYIFLGSIESIMNKIFFNKNSGFFHFAKPIELGGLDTNELREYCEFFFNSKGVTIAPFIYEVLEYLEGHPYYCMKVLQHLYYSSIDTKKTILQKEDIIEALSSSILDTKPYLDEIIEKIKLKKHHHEVLYALANNKDNKLDSATLYQTYKSLENMGYVAKKSRGKYKITDIFLKIYLQQNDDKKLIEEKMELKELYLK